MERIWTVWVGGGEVNDSLLTYEEAVDIANKYKDKGYDDVIVDNYSDEEILKILQAIHGGKIK